MAEYGADVCVYLYLPFINWILLFFLWHCQFDTININFVFIFRIVKWNQNFYGIDTAMKSRSKCHITKHTCTSENIEHTNKTTRHEKRQTLTCTFDGLMCAILWVWDLVARMKRTKKYIEVWQTIFHRIKYTLLWVVWPETRWFDEHIRYCVREKFDNEIKSNMNSILITGCNRGLGLGIVKQLLASNKPTKHIFATCRNPDQAQVT